MELGILVSFWTVWLLPGGHGFACHESALCLLLPDGVENSYARGLFVIHREGLCLLFENTWEWVEMRVRTTRTVAEGVSLDSSF